MALQTVLFVIGLLLLAGVFWFSGGRELVAQKLSERAGKRSNRSAELSNKSDQKTRSSQKQSIGDKLQSLRENSSLARKTSQGITPGRKSSRGKMTKEPILAQQAAVDDDPQHTFGVVENPLERYIDPTTETRSQFGKDLIEEGVPEQDDCIPDAGDYVDEPVSVRDDGADIGIPWEEEVDEVRFRQQEFDPDKDLTDVESSSTQAVESEYVNVDDDHHVPLFLVDGEDNFNGVKIDYCAYVTGDNLVSREQALEVYRQSEFELPKTHRLFARRDSDQQWRDLELEPDDGEYGDIAVTLQLADRDGPVSQSNLTRFSSLVLRVSEALDRKFRFSSSFEEALTHAQNLDEFCRQYDVVAAVYILANEDQAFNGQDIDRIARSYGLLLGDRKIYHRMSADNEMSLFSMANIHNPGSFEPDHMADFATDGLVIFINMPCTPNPDKAYRAMVDTAELLCADLGGRLVDQSKKSITKGGLNSTKQQIEQIAKDMESEGVAPGSIEAVRLFS